MATKVRYEDCTPTRAGYMSMLDFIIKHSTDTQNKVWARTERMRVKAGHVGPFADDPDFVPFTHE